MIERTHPEHIWAYDDGADVMAFDWDNAGGGAVKYVRADVTQRQLSATQDRSAEWAANFGRKCGEAAELGAEVTRLHTVVSDLQRQLSEAVERAEKAERERDEARSALERDRSIVITACNEFSDAFARRSWLLEGRGPYEWDDDRYRDEFSQAYNEMNAPIERLRKIGRDWSNCPTDPEEIRNARQDWKSRATAAEAEVARLREALKFYADVSKYPAPLTGGMGALWSDCGQIARAALQGEPKP